MAEPKLYSKNYISGDCVFTMSHGAVTQSYLYDRDPASQYVSVGADDDATEMTIEASFYEGSVAVSRYVDTLFLLNHNFETWAFETWDGAEWDVQASDTDDAETDEVFSFTGVTTSKVRLRCTVTQTADAEKVIGEFVVAAALLDIGVDMASYDPRSREKVKDIVLGDGSIHRVITRITPNRTQKYEARIGFRYLTKAQRDALKAVKESGEPFLWQPESSYLPEVIYYVHWANAFDDKYSSTYKGAGYDLTLDLKEV